MSSFIPEGELYTLPLYYSSVIASHEHQITLEEGRQIMVRRIINCTLCTVGIVFASTYYVATWGSDDSSGTFTAPWRTINKAAQTMIAGDSVLIREGTYPESVNPANSGSPGQKITYAAYGNEAVIVEGSEEITDWVQDNGNRYRASVTFTPSPRFSTARDPAGNLGGLVIQNGAKMKYAMCLSITEVDEPGEYYMNDSAGMGPPYTIYVHVRDLGQGYDPNYYQMMIGRRRKGFDLDGGEDYIVVDGLIFRDYNDNAIHSIASNYCDFKNTMLHTNFITGIYLTSYSRYCTITQCRFWDNGHGGIELARSHSTTIKRNEFTGIDLGDGLGGNGAHIWVGPLTYYSDSCLIENNIGFRTGSDYLPNGPFLAIRGADNMIRHNSALFFGTGGIALISGGDNTVINNAIDCNTGVACINVFPEAVAAGGHFIQYNDFYAADPTGKYRWDGVAYNSLSEWEAASGQINNIDSEPGFAEPDSGDLHLITGSACIDVGTASNAASEDYDGISRPQGAGYDIGAYEYTQVSVVEQGNYSPGEKITITENPARYGVWIRREHPETMGHISIYDLAGRLVKTRSFIPGEMLLFWNGRDNSGKKLPDGIYLILYTVDLEPLTERKVILLH